MSSNALKSQTERAVAWALEQWRGWTLLTPAKQNRKRDEIIVAGGGQPNRTSRSYWCGWFLSAAYPEMHGKLRVALLPSTYRLSLMGHYRIDPNLWKSNDCKGKDGVLTTVPAMHESKKAKRKAAIEGQIEKFAVNAGDVICTGDGATGAHINIAILSSAPGEPVKCVSGNGWGLRFDGSTGGGIVTNEYERKQIKAIYRFSTVDFDQSVWYRARP